MVAQDVEKLKQAFGDREFTGKDVARVLGLTDFRTSGTIVKTLRRDGLAYQTINGWRFGTPPDAPVKAEYPAPALSAELCSAPSLVRIGDLFLHERLLLIASVQFQEASPAIRIHTTILELDPATKHPRNKVLNFIKARDPREYAQAMAWLDSMAGSPPAADDTALELAADLEIKLNAARKEIADLKAKIEAIRGAL